MNIAFDAKRYFHNNTGLGNYSRSLVNNMAELHAENKYYLCNPKKSNHYTAPLLPNVHTLMPHGFIQKKLKNIWRSKWVISDLKKHNINLYHGLSHEIPVGIQHTNIASVVTMHDLIFEIYPKQFKAIDRALYSKKFRNAAKNANAIIAISTQTKTDLINLYKVEENKIHICYQSCDDAFKVSINKNNAIAFLEKHQLPTEYLLYVGSIIERKNLLLILKAILLMPREKRIPLIIVGKGDYYEKIVRQFVAENKLEKWAIFLNDKIANGAYIFEHLPLLYNAAQIFIYPSIYEGFGIPLLEAMYCQCPVITSNLSCLPETVGTAGICTSPTDASLLMEHIFKLQNDASLKNSMVVNGLQQAALFSTENSVNSVLKVYNSIT